MANIKLIKKRIKSAKNIAQITKAMEMVAASKMKRAQARAMAGSLYAQKIFNMVTTLSRRVNYTQHPLLSRPAHSQNRILVILISSNKGLSGGLNTNLFRFVSSVYAQNDVEFATIGKKGADFVVRIGKNIIADFSDTVPFTNTVAPIIDLASEKFLSGEYARIDLVFSQFLSIINQKPKGKTILPLSLDSAPETDEKAEKTDFLIEPDPKTVFDSLLPHYLENQVRDAVYQAEASEHSARMVAMRNATDNAISLTEELTLVYNKARQEKITYEITDMVTARMAAES